MSLVIGFARGGTHLFWCFLSSHPSLESRKEEVNDMVGLRRLGLARKIAVEASALTNNTFVSVDGTADSSIVDKMVCAWSISIFYNAFRRDDPTKYVDLFGHKSDIVFLVKSPGLLKNSWTKRGATEEQFDLAYRKHITRWKAIASRTENSVAIPYELFAKDPIVVTEAIWGFWGLSKREFPSSIEWKPKAHSNDPNLPSASSNKRVWTISPTPELVASLSRDVFEPVSSPEHDDFTSEFIASVNSSSAFKLPSL